TEVAVICQYLGDQKPQAGLVPQSGTMERYRLMEALNFASSEVHKQIGALFNPNLTAEMKEVQLGVIGRRLDALEKLLDGNQFITGDKYTVADAYLFTVLNWSNIHKIDLAKMAEHQGIHGSHRCKAEGAGNHAGGRSAGIAHTHPARLHEVRSGHRPDARQPLGLTVPPTLLARADDTDPAIEAWYHPSIA